MAGLAAGTLAVSLATEFVRGLLYEVSPMDPPTVVVAAVILLVVAIVASGLPALRATRVEPTQALRAP